MAVAEVGDGTLAEARALGTGGGEDVESFLMCVSEEEAGEEAGNLYMNSDDDRESDRDEIEFVEGGGEREV